MISADDLSFVVVLTVTLAALPLSSISITLAVVTRVPDVGIGYFLISRYCSPWRSIIYHVRVITIKVGIQG